MSNNKLDFIPKNDGPKMFVMPSAGALPIRNNGQSGRFTIGENELGDKLRFIPIKFKTFFGSLGITEDVYWGQLFFVPIAGSSPGIPLDIVCVTYLKNASLTAFKTPMQLIEGILGEGPKGEKLWTASYWEATFKKISTTKPDETGALKPINYYILEFDAEPIPEDDKISKQDRPHIEKWGNTIKTFGGWGAFHGSELLADPLGTRRMRPAQLNEFSGAFDGGEDAPALPEHPEMRSAAVTADGLIDSPF